MGGAAKAVTAMHEAGRVGADAYRRLVGLLDVFDDFGDPAVAAAGAVVHLTWAAGGATATVSVGGAGFWGVALCHGADRMACDVGTFADADGRHAFGGLVMMAKAVLVGAVVTAAERQLNAAGGRPKEPEKG